MTSPYVPVDLDQTVTHRLHELSKLTDRVTQLAYETEVGIPMHEGRCLAAIGAFAPLSINDLARQANLNKAPASRAAQSLVEQGLVRKTASAEDGRGVILTLTTKGRRVWLRAMALIERRNAEIASCLEPAEQKQFSGMLERLVRHARESASALETPSVKGSLKKGGRAGD